MFTFLRLIGFLAIVQAFGPNDKNWEYTMVECSMHSSDESILKIEARIERLGRGEFGLTGQLMVGQKIPESMEAEVLCYRSPDGGDNYKLQPYSVPRQGIYKALNSFYKDMIMESAKDCSTLPQFNGTLLELGPETFVYSKCKPKTDNFPKVLPEGYYKLVFKTFGLVEATFELIARIDKKMM